MKTASILVLGLTLSAGAMAGKIECKSSGHGLLIEGKSASYSINGETSEAEVVLENLKKSNGFLTASINIDGQAGHMKLAAIKTKEKTYEGKLQVFKNKLYDVTCTE